MGTDIHLGRLTQVLPVISAMTGSPPLRSALQSGATWFYYASDSARDVGHPSSCCCQNCCQDGAA